MAFESLTEKLQNVFKNLRGKGKLSEADVKLALKEVKLALLEADVNFKVVKKFIADVQERAVGAEVMNSLTPAQQVVKIVNEELIKLIGEDTKELELKSGDAVNVIMMMGLQGAGKTTTAAKLAGKLKSKGFSPLLVACDIYRPAAIDQLKINAEKQAVAFFSMGDNISPVDIAKASIEFAKNNHHNVVIIDTAGRLHIDEQLMGELQGIKDNFNPHEILLVVDGMTGQDAVNVAKTFNEQLDITGVVLTKLDGDTRGGAALSVKEVAGKPIKFISEGEKLDDIAPFHPDRLASRILGMGDVVSLVEKAQEAIDEKEAKKMEEKFRKNQFDFEDFLKQFKMIRKMGSIAGIMKMIPGVDTSAIDMAMAEKEMKRVEAIIFSMTVQERRDPKLLKSGSRKARIAKGSGVQVTDVNKLIKQFEQMKQMMKMFNSGAIPGLGGGMMRGKGKRKK